MNLESSVTALETRQEAMASDIADMKKTLANIAEAMTVLSGVEQRQSNLTEAIARAHARIDDVESLVKDEVKGHEKRIQAIEIGIAKNQWIERFVMAALMTGIGVWIKGGL